MKNKKSAIPLKKTKNKITLSYLKKNKAMLIALLIAMVLIIFCIYKLVTFIKEPTSTFTVEQGKIYQDERATGYIIREETVIKGNNYKNGMEKIRAEGERVAKDDPIFRYYSNGEENLIKKIAELDLKINEALAKEEGILNSDIKALEKQIETNISSLHKVNNLQTIKETKKQILNSITKKAKIAGEYSPAGSYLKKLIDERKTYENKLNEGSEYLNATVSGVVSYKVDGYEEAFTTNDFSKLNSEFLEDLNIKTGQVVADSSESAKIINNFVCYITCVLESEQAKNANIGDKVELRLPNNKQVSSKIASIIQEDKKTVVVFEIDTQVQELISYRKISFDIIWWSDNGKKIPNDAIKYEQKAGNQVAYVVRTRMGYQNKILIKILRQNDKYAIVDNYTSTELEELGYSTEEIQDRRSLTLYDEILKNPT